MPFSSPFFLFAFLPLFLATYYLVPRAGRNAVALIGSLLFYAWGAPKFVLVLVAVSGVDFCFALYIARAADGPRRRLALGTAVSLNLLLLFYFKYVNFFARQGNSLLSATGFPQFAWQDVALPMGISFIVFEEISYVVDVYRRAAQPAAKFSQYLLFLSLFPHSIAGPIFRWQDLAEQLRSRVHSVDGAFEGFLRFCFGLAKKALVANQVAAVADRVFGHEIGSLPTAYAWVGLVAYTLQIYFDFSGYSDMAIGLGKMLGFSFKENFDSPYISTSMTEFWRRWHMSLSAWLRDYLYIPLGGSRAGTFKLYRNLIIVFLCCGFWHGANWTFLAWGAYHGGWLVVERTAAWRRVSSWLPAPLALGFTFVWVMLGWVLFRSDSLSHATGMFSRLFSWHAVAASGTSTSWGELMSHRAAVTGSTALLMCFANRSTLVEGWTGWLMGKRPRTSDSVFGELFRWSSATVGLALSAMSLVSSTFNPFIYFRF